MSLSFEMNIKEGQKQYFQTDKGNILEVYRDNSFPNPRDAGLTHATRISGRYHSEAYRMAELNMVTSPEVPAAQLSAIDKMLLRPELNNPAYIPTKTDELRVLTGVATPKLHVPLADLQTRIENYIDEHADEFSPGAKHFRPLDEMLAFCQEHGIQTDDMLLLCEVEEGQNIVLYLYDDVRFKAETGMELKDAPAELKKAVMDEAVKMYTAFNQEDTFACNVYNAKGKHIAEHRGFFGSNIQENGMLDAIGEKVTKEIGQFPSIGIAQFRVLRKSQPELQSLSSLIKAAAGEEHEASAATSGAKNREDR